MFSVEVIPGVSIVIRSKDPNFSPNDMIFVTEYSGMSSSPSSMPLQLSILKESDQHGHLIRIQVISPTPARDSPPSPMGYSATNYSSPAPPFVHQIAFLQKDPDSLAAQRDILDFSDFGRALNDFQDVFPATYGDFSPSLGLDSPSASDHLFASSHGFFMNSTSLAASSYDIPRTSSFITSAPMIHGPPLSPSSQPKTTTSQPLQVVGSPPLLSSKESDHSSPSQYSPSTACSPSPSRQPLDQDDPKRIFTCRHDGCDKRFARKYHREVHESSHKPKARLILTCREEECTAKFGRPHDRMRHEVAKHGMRPNFVCEECGKFFGTESKLRGHKCDSVPAQRHRWSEGGAERE